MHHGKIALAAISCALLSACAPDHVIFITDTSLGINVETKPSPTASVAFDRTEGYIAPHYANGALPPVVGSIHVEGASLLSPTAKQLYATGPAAVIVSGGQATDPSALKGDKQWAFFGTSTSVGVKLAFDTATGAPVPVPDSFLFGYRRKEFSYIPIGTDPDTKTDTYGSALASVNSGTNAGGDASSSAFQHSQFIATGLAADALAKDTEIQNDFRASATTTATGSLTPAAQDAAIALGNKDYETQSSNLTIVLNAVQTSGQLDQGKLKSLIDKANTPTTVISPGSVTTLENSSNTTATIRALLEANQAATSALAKAVGSP